MNWFLEWSFRLDNVFFNCVKCEQEPDTGLLLKRFPFSLLISRPFFKIANISPFSRNTDAPALELWWCLIWVSKPGWVILLACFVALNWRIFRTYCFKLSYIWKILDIPEWFIYWKIKNWILDPNFHVHTTSQFMNAVHCWFVKKSLCYFGPRFWPSYLGSKGCIHSRAGMAQMISA